MDLTLFNANLGPDQASKAQAAASPLQPQPDEPPPPWSGAQGAVCACGCRGLLTGSVCLWILARAQAWVRVWVYVGW